MTDHDNSQAEPTMEEILASIRRIISEDNEETEAAAAPAPEVNGAEEKPGEPADDGAEVLELSQEQVVEDPKPAPAEAPQPNGFDTQATVEPAPAPQFRTQFNATPDKDTALVDTKPEEAVTTEAVEETLLSPEVVTAATAALGALSKDVVVSSGDGKSLEDIIREMMKPLLKEWLDDNLPPLVESVVEREVRQISRRVRR